MLVVFSQSCEREHLEYNAGCVLTHSYVHVSYTNSVTQVVHVAPFIAILHPDNCFFVSLITISCSFTSLKINHFEKDKNK